VGFFAFALSGSCHFLAAAFPSGGQGSSAALRWELGPSGIGYQDFGRRN